MTTYVVPVSSTPIPLNLTVTQEGVGGVEGLSPTVAMRRGEDPTLYLDWADSTFKTSGWTQRYATMVNLGRGHYNRALALATIGAEPDDLFVVEYHVNEGAVKGDATDIVICSNAGDFTFLRKAVTNRMEETPGNPGHLTLYDDDGLTPLARWELRDATGGQVLSTVGNPSRRSARVL